MRPNLIPAPENILPELSVACLKVPVDLQSTDTRHFSEIPFDGAFSKLYSIPAFLNSYADLDTVFGKINAQLSEGERFFGKAKTNGFYKRAYFQKGVAGRIQYLFDVLWHRVFPKMNRVFNRIYAVLATKDRRYSKTEILGRLIASGFSVHAVSESPGGELFFCAVKFRDKISPAGNNSYWPVFRMRRVGRGGKQIVVYKLRTMHPYAEFVQDYMMRQNGLEDNGKFRNDFRVTSWGRLLRKYWIDELPMIYNWIRGDIKLIGVRPISEKFLKIYPEELRAYRNQFKPGLIPPYYADLPGNFEGILDSERKYLAAYSKKPLQTDFTYFFKIIKNIAVKKVRSK